MITPIFDFIGVTGDFKCFRFCF